MEDQKARIGGVVSLFPAVLAASDTPLMELIEDELITAEADATECARYDLLSLPVLDENGAMLGLITVDDILDEVVPED